MTTWTWQAQFGITGGLVLFAAILLPVLVLQYRRYGELSLRRLIGAAAVSIYGVSLVAYTLLPLPEAATVCVGGGAPLELVPFHSFDDIARETVGLGPLATLTSRASLQVILNVALFLPLGVLVRRYWHRGAVVATLTGLAASLVIETVQATGILGLYDCAYRVADVDDLIANTLGALLGALLAPAVLWWMPRSRELAARRLDPRPMTVWRRWLGMLLDLLAYGIVATLVAAVPTTVRILTSDAVGGAVSRPGSLAEVLLIGGIPALTVFYLPALLGWGGSLGQRLVWIAPVWDGRRGSTGRRLWRASVLGGLYSLSLLVTGIGEHVDSRMLGVLSLPLAAAATGVVLLSGLVMVVSAIAVLTTRGHRGFSAVVSGADMVDVRALPNPAEAGTTQTHESPEVLRIR